MRCDTLLTARMGSLSTLKLDYCSVRRPVSIAYFGVVSSAQAPRLGIGWLAKPYLRSLSRAAFRLISYVAIFFHSFTSRDLHPQRCQASPGARQSFNFTCLLIFTFRSMINCLSLIFLLVPYFSLLESQECFKCKILVQPFCV